MSVEETVPIQVVAYRDICQHPEDDTLRLQYADLLDEIGDERVPCPKCKGEKTVPYCSRFMYSCAELNVECDCGSLKSCDKCDGDGTVLSTANRDRAEFIRVQCELERYDPAAHHPVCLGPRSPQCRFCHYLSPREEQLRNAHPEWLKYPCPACEVEGVPVGTFEGGVACGTCGGTGDLFVRLHPAGNGDRLPRPVTFSRGFLDSVECTAADVWREVECGICGGDGLARDYKRWGCLDCGGNGHRPGRGRVTVPTEWAKAVVRETPVTKFDIGAWTGLLSFAVPSQNYKDVPSLIGEWVRREAFKKEKE